MKENEPLLKEEKDSLFIGDNSTSKVELPEYNKTEEPIPVIEDENIKITVEPPKEEKKPEKKSKKALIITLILAAIILYVLGKAIYSYYLGFKYKDYDPNQQTENIDVDNKEEEVFLESVILLNNYKKFQINLCSNNGNLIDKMYLEKSVTLSNLTNIEIGTIIFNNVNNLPTCDGEAVSISLENIKTLSQELLGSDSYVNELLIESAIYGNLNVTFDSTNNTFNIKVISCEVCTNNSFSLSKLEKAITKDEYLYIYERFGLFKYNELKENTYTIYADGLGNKELGTFVKESEAEYTDYSKLQLYKWTLKKGNDNNYYFVSLEQSN